MLATFLPTGSVSWLYYSDRLSELPLGVFGVAIATVILPNLSRHYAAESNSEFSATLDWALRMILLVAVPAAIALIILAEPILVTLFYYGDVMTSRDMAMASLSLRAYAAGLVAFMLIKVLAPGFFARQDMRTPVRIGIIAMASNMILNIVFVVPLHFYWEIGHLGLAAATSLSAALNAILLFFCLRRDGIYTPNNRWMRFFMQLLVSVTIMVLALLILSNHFNLLDSDIWQQKVWWSRLSGILIVCGLGFSLYILALFFSGFRLADFQGPNSAVGKG
jgi:putative peptidoglycan lipid II flippase